NVCPGTGSRPVMQSKPADKPKRDSVKSERVPDIGTLEPLRRMLKYCHCDMPGVFHSSHIEFNLIVLCFAFVVPIIGDKYPAGHQIHGRKTGIQDAGTSDEHLDRLAGTSR